MTTAPPILTVSQLTQAIKLSLESTFPMICLQGEISNFKAQTSGHLYFSLKDADAQIAVVMFRQDAILLKNMPKSGDHVVVKGDLNVYPPKGGYQLVIKELSYMGIGALLQQLEQLKIKLHQRGWFKSDFKKKLPKIPKRIGVVTSPTGAVIQDILKILIRRFSNFHLILNPVKVQGDGAAQEIALAIEQFNHHNLVDVIIVGRGGGSLEDLWAFNEEIVAEAIFKSRIPIISAVGHETDHCIADYVADVRAPTPSAAAEIVIVEKGQLLDYIQGLRKRMQQTIGHVVHKDRCRLQGLQKHPFLLNPLSIFRLYMQKLDDTKSEMHQSILRQIQIKRQKLESLSRQASALNPTTQLLHMKQKLTQHRIALQQAWSAQYKFHRQRLDSQKKTKQFDQIMIRHLALWRERLAHLKETLQALDPKNVLTKGYSILFAENENSVINSVNKLEVNQNARVLLSDGEVQITINKIIPREHTYSRQIGKES